MKFDYVYFAKAGNAMKIGWAFNPVERVRSLQTGCPEKIRIITVIPCYYASEYEKYLHDKFEDSRMYGEWFKSEPVVDWLESNALPDYELGDLLDNFTPEGYWLVVGEKFQRKRLLRQIAVKLMDSKISTLQFCKDTGLSFLEMMCDNTIEEFHANAND